MTPFPETPGSGSGGADAGSVPEGALPFTVAIPVYNEEAILVPNTERLLAYLRDLGREFEIIIGSNGSTDSTTTLGDDLSRRFPRVSFFHIPHRGVGLAFREFVRRARYPLLVSVDMDLSVELEFVGDALRLLAEHDVVVGSKKLGSQERTLVRRLGSDMFLRAARILLGMTYEDYSLAAKGYRVEILRRFARHIGSGSAYVLEMCFLTERAGGRVIQVPVSCKDFRRSKFNLVREALYKYNHLVRLWLRTRKAR